MVPESIPESEHAALYEAYLAEIVPRERLRLIAKADSRLCRVIDRLLRVLTFGGQDRFQSDYVTTLGRRIYLPACWDAIPPGHKYCIMRHELVHVRQFRRLTWPLITLIYLLLPLPVGFAGGRAWLEWEAYKETLLATWEVFGEAAARCPRARRDMLRRFTGPDYGWMWVRERTVDAAIERQLARLAARFHAE